MQQFYTGVMSELSYGIFEVFSISDWSFGLLVSVRKLFFWHRFSGIAVKKCHGKLRAALLPADVRLFIGRTLAGVVISDLPPCVAKDNSSFVKGIALEWTILWLSILNKERTSFHEIALIAKCEKEQLLCSMDTPWL